LTLKFTVTVPADTEALVITGSSEGVRSGVDVVRVVVGDSVVLLAAAPLSLRSIPMLVLTAALE